MQSSHDANNTMLARCIRPQPETFFEPGDATHEHHIAAPSLSEIMQTNAGGVQSPDQVDIYFFHRRLNVDITRRIEDVLVIGDSRVGNDNVHAPEGLLSCLEQGKLVLIRRGVAGYEVHSISELR